jgi:hypothetical protein
MPVGKRLTAVLDLRTMTTRVTEAAMVEIQLRDAKATLSAVIDRAR